MWHQHLICVGVYIPITYFLVFINLEEFPFHLNECQDRASPEVYGSQLLLGLKPILLDDTIGMSEGVHLVNYLYSIFIHLRVKLLLTED
jgi:hypothetical protein